MANQIARSATRGPAGTLRVETPTGVTLMDAERRAAAEFCALVLPGVGLAALAAAGSRAAGSQNRRPQRGSEPAPRALPAPTASRLAALISAACLAALPALAAPSEPARSEPARSEPAQSEPAPSEPAPPPPTRGAFTETVTVTGTRLADRDEPAREVPASTTVISRAEIGASGARTVQELLGRIAGAVLYDQIGNAVQTTFDLRGFTGGGITVLVDGARVNDPRNNAVQLETIALDAVERIEIVRGSAAATVGGGSAAGVVNIVTRSGGPAPFRGALTGAYGSFATRRIALDLSGRIPRGGGKPLADQTPSDGNGGIPASTWSVDEDRADARTNPDDTAHSETTGLRTGPASAGRQFEPDRERTAGFDWLLSAARDRTDGFRENADATLDRVTAALGYDFPNAARLALAVHTADDDLGAPGALTLAEFDDRPARAPFNALDGSSLTYRQGVLNWLGPAGEALSLAANISYLSRTSKTLTTGRAAVSSGGFILDARVRTLGGALQATAQFRTGALPHTFVFGGEASGGTSAADGCGTFPADLAACDPASFFASSNSTRRRDLAVFAQDSVRLGADVTVLAGARWDRSGFAYRETVPDPDNDRRKTIAETSWKAGLTWNPAAAVGLYTSYGESFLPPSVEDLFAFPEFGSNPELRPVIAKNYEAGLRGVLSGRGRTAERPSFPEGKAEDLAFGGGKELSPSAFTPSLDYALSVFRTDLTNEIVFVPMPTPANHFGGKNLNAARSLRAGIELSGNWRIYRWLSWIFTYARTRATFQSGANAGRDVPLVPGNRYSESTQLTLPRGFGARVDLLHVGKQVLSGDEANRRQRLHGYLTLDARITWRPGELRRSARAASIGPHAEAGFAASASPSPDAGSGASLGGFASAASTTPAGRFASTAQPAALGARPSALGSRIEIELFLEGRNLLDRAYATRGIDGFTSTFASATFVTPAPPRTITGGASIVF